LGQPVCNVLQQCIFGWKMVRSAVHNAFLNTLTTEMVFPRVPLEMIFGPLSV